MTFSEQKPIPALVDGTKCGTKKPRRRTPRACDRCRLKKAKCDGRNRCNTCDASDSICVFSTRKDGHARNYYSHMRGLTDEALQLLYTACREGKLLPGLNFKGDSNGHATTSEILQGLGLIGPDVAGAPNSDGEARHDPSQPYESCSPRTPNSWPPASTMPSTPFLDIDEPDTGTDEHGEQLEKSSKEDLHTIPKDSSHVRSKFSQTFFLDSVAESVELSADFTRVMYDGHELVWPQLKSNN